MTNKRVRKLEEKLTDRYRKQGHEKLDKLIFFCFQLEYLICFDKSEYCQNISSYRKFSQQLIMLGLG